MNEQKRMLEYRTVAQYAAAEITEKKSRFIGYIKPVETEQEALDFINEIKSRHWDATHNVYAYIIEENNICRYSDDGEPSGTAGIPALEVLKKEELQNVVAVVTRYFGGTLLGTGGLVRAYAKSVKESINVAGTITMRLCRMMKIKIDYTLLGKIQNEIVDSGYIIDDILYQEDVTLLVYTAVTEVESFIKNMVEVANGRVIIEQAAKSYIGIDQTGKLGNAKK